MHFSGPHPGPEAMLGALRSLLHVSFSAGLRRRFMLPFSRCRAQVWDSKAEFFPFCGVWKLARVLEWLVLW